MASNIKDTNHALVTFEIYVSYTDNGVLLK